MARGTEPSAHHLHPTFPHGQYPVIYEISARGRADAHMRGCFGYHAVADNARAHAVEALSLIELFSLGVQSIFQDQVFRVQ